MGDLGGFGADWRGVVKSENGGNLVSNYQMFYGTVIYFLSFFMNNRHHNKSITEVALFVGLSNGIWFFFPLLGMYINYELIVSGSMHLLR